MATKMKKASSNAFAAAGDVLGLGLGGGVDALFGGPAAGEAYDTDVLLDDIEVAAQVRSDFESADNTLKDLGDSLARYQLQNIVLRVNDAGREKPYMLIAGERRLRAAQLVKLPTLRARVFPLSSKEAEEAQFVENVHRLNLSQIEEARRVQRDLDELGSTEAVCAKYNKGAPWLSKLLGLLKLPKEASRLITEGVSADVELINQVRQIETVNPKKAAEVVDTLKANRGKVNARDVVVKAKDEVKPSKKKAATQAAAAKEMTAAPLKPAKGWEMPSGGSVATSKDRTQEQPSAGDIFSGAKSGTGKKPQQILSDAYSAIFDERKRPASVLDALPEQDRDAATEWLQGHFEAGKRVKDLGRVVIEGMRKGVYSTDGEGALALVALLNGAEGGVPFDMLNIFGAVK
jgi:ParB family chromosome partitioning protein